MMRLNAPIPALLVFAVVYFFPADSLAKPAHPLARKTTSTAHSTHRRPAAQSTHTSRHATTSKSAATRIHTHRAARHQASAHYKAAHYTPARYRRSRSSYYQTQAPLAIHGTSRPDEPSETSPSSGARMPTSGARVPASKPVSVVSVIRPTTDHPQLPSVEDVVSTPVILPALYNKRGRLIVPPPLRGSREILVHQNLVADHDGLDRIRDDADLLDMRSQRLLVSLPANDALQIDDRLPEDRRFCRPWTAHFLATLARAHYAHFHSPLQINSAVRTVEFQQHLVHINGNAAPAEGDTASPHLTGQAIDIAKHGLSLTEIAWLRGYLLPLVQEGKVDVEEEFQQSCFHISVYRKYLPSSEPNRGPATPHHSETTALASALR